jgi:UDP-glucose 4-epimerase
MRCLVTGGAGFLGLHMVERLRAEGHNVLTIDTKGVKRYPFQHMNLDVRRPLKFTLSAPLDWVFHFAGLAAIPPSLIEPANYMAVNAQGTAHVLEAARKAGCKRFIYAASGTCYGNNPTFPTGEYAPILPDTPYALSKWMGELLMHHWDRVFDLPSVSLRLFSPYGPRMGLTSAMGHFLKLRREGKPIQITGDGEQYRDMHYVDDCIEAFMLAAKSDVRDVAINIGSGQPVTLNQLADALGCKRTYIPARNEARGTHADIRHAKTLLGWEPKVSFEEGIRRTVA